MPLQQILPTWLAWNNANFPTASGINDFRTGQDFPAGGLGLGDYFDATEKEANAQSFLPNGLLHWGRYRLVQVDSGATAANVRTGTVGYMRQGPSIDSVLSPSPSLGVAPGTYTAGFPPGFMGGSGAKIRITIDASGEIVPPITVLNGGNGYIGPGNLPLSSLVGADGITPVFPGSAFPLYANVGAYTPNIVTSADMSYLPPNNTLVATRPFIFLNSITPGNYGFVQEQGVAMVITGGNITPPSLVRVNSSSGIVTPYSGFDPSAGTVGMSLSYAFTATGGWLKILIMAFPCQD